MVQFVLNVLALFFVHTAGVEQGDSMAHISLGEHLEKKSQLVGKKPFPLVRLWLS